MKRILSIAALIAGAVALAGCGGSSNTSATAGGTATGAHQAHVSATFRARIHSFEASLQSSVQAFQSGNLSKAAKSAFLVTKCSGMAAQLESVAKTPADKEAVFHLRQACTLMSKASNAGVSGHMAKAKQYARASLMQARIAGRISG